MENKCRVVDYEEVIGDVKETKKSDLLKKAVNKAKYIWWNIDNWICNNKENIAFVVGTGSVGLTAVAGLLRAVNNSGFGAKRQKKAKDLVYWDPSSRHHWTLRRELSNNEWAEVERRRRNGEKLGDILEDMRVLK